MRDFVIGEIGSFIHQATLERFFANRSHIHTGAVVGDAQHDFRAFPPEFKRDISAVLFTRLAARLRCFDAVIDGITQHVLQRRGQLVQYRAVHFAFGAEHVQLNLFAQLLGRLAHDAPQARHNTGKRHQTCAHQTILQCGSHARLLQQ